MSSVKEKNQSDFFTSLINEQNHNVIKKKINNTDDSNILRFPLQKQPLIQGQLDSLLRSNKNPSNEVPSHLHSFVLIGSDTVELTESLLLRDLLKYNIIIPVFNDVKHYLLQFQDLIAILPEVCKTIRANFDSNTELSLELYLDPEIKDEYLTLYIRQFNYESNLLDKINNIHTQYEEQLSNISGYFLITTDYRPPRLKNNV